VRDSKFNSANIPGSANLPIGGVAFRPSTIPPSKPEWRSRGYLPHFDPTNTNRSPGGIALIQHVTFRLADSLPQSELDRIESELESLPLINRDVELRKRVEAWIDAGHGSCLLGDSSIANMVQGSLLFFDSQRYRLLAWVVMPNHVHALFEPRHPWTVANILASWKKFTARKILDCQHSRLKACIEPIWQREYWDRYIRDHNHFEKTIAYIHQNPVKARLASAAENWQWSSAFRRSAIPGRANPGSANLPIGNSKNFPP
jgi:putative transposase